MLRGMLLGLMMMVSLGALAEPAGEVVLSVGDAYAENIEGARRALVRGDKVHTYDRIVTGESGRVHMRFSDGGTVNLKPDSVFQVAKYHFQPEDPESGSAVFQLLKGGLRTISGQIGKANPDNVRIQSVLATIGIRGTDYELYLCDKRCAEQNNLGSGIAGGVDAGGIYVDTAVGSADLEIGRYFQLDKGADEMALLDERPPMLKIGDDPYEVRTKPVRYRRCGKSFIPDDKEWYWVQCGD